MNVEYLGNKELLKVRKTAFLASSTISSETVLRCYDWATEIRSQGIGQQCRKAIKGHSYGTQQIHL